MESGGERLFENNSTVYGTQRHTKNDMLIQHGGLNKYRSKFLAVGAGEMAQR